MGYIIKDNENILNGVLPPNTLDADAVPSDVIKGKVFYNSNGRNVGTFDNTGIEVTQILSCGETFTGPEGLYKTINIKADTLQNQTLDATAAPNDIKKGKTAYVSGELIEGQLEIIDTKSATATSEDIVEGKTAYVNDEEITGSISINKDLNIISEYGESQGYSKEVYSEDIEGLYKAGKLYVPLYNMRPECVRAGEEIVVGNKIIKGKYTENLNSNAHDVLEGKLVGIEGKIVEGVIPDYSRSCVDGGSAEKIDSEGVSTIDISKVLYDGESVKIDIPEGYHRKSVIKVVNTDLAKSLNLDGNNIIADANILGVNGRVLKLENTGIRVSNSNPNSVVNSNTAYYNENSDGKNRVCLRVAVNGVMTAGTCVGIEDSILASVLEVTPDKIVKGNTILGIKGDVILPTVSETSVYGVEDYIVIENKFSTYKYMKVELFKEGVTLGSIIVSDTQFREMVKSNGSLKMYVNDSEAFKVFSDDGKIRAEMYDGDMLSVKYIKDLNM